MTQLKMDKIIMSSDVETYLNYETVTITITISGTVANGNSTVFSGYIPYARSKTRADIYVKNLNTNIKRPLWGGIRQGPYQSTGAGEIYTQFASYGGDTISVSLTVSNNTGGPVVLTTQIMEVTAVLVEVPQAGGS